MSLCERVDFSLQDRANVQSSQLEICCAPFSPSAVSCDTRLVSPVAAVADQLRCQNVVVTDLFTFVGWQEHEISSGCAAAG